HVDRVPGAALEIHPEGALRRALLAADALERIDPDPVEHRSRLVDDEDHAVLDGAEVLADGRTGAARALLVDRREDLRLALPLLGLRGCHGERILASLRETSHGGGSLSRTKASGCR